MLRRKKILAKSKKIIFKIEKLKGHWHVRMIKVLFISFVTGTRSSLFFQRVSNTGRRTRPIDPTHFTYGLHGLVANSMGPMAGTYPRGPPQNAPKGRGKE